MEREHSRDPKWLLVRRYLRGEGRPARVFVALEPRVSWRRRSYMKRITGSRLASVLSAAAAGSLCLALVGAPAASARSVTGVHPHHTGASCHPAVLAGAGGYLGHFKTVCTIASTVPSAGDVNPYGVAVVPSTTGNLVAGDVLVSNFNNSKNLQGTGTTIMEVSPAGTAKLFANLGTQTKNHVGLTTALTVFRNGDVVVGSLPTTDGTAATATAGALYVLNSKGQLIETITGTGVNGPWDMASYDGGGFGVLFVTNVLYGTVAAKGKVVKGGNVVRFVLDLTKTPPAVLQRTVIGNGYPERTDPAAMVIGPTGVALGSNGTVYVADSLDNRIMAIPDGLFATGSAGVGKVVTSGQFLNDPLGLATAPGGDLISPNGNNGMIVESTQAGVQPEWPSVDTSGSPPGAGALFGLAVVPGGKGVYFVDDATNTLDIFK
jgi:hypothetical protein